MGRALAITLFLVLTVVVPFLLWGDALDVLLSQDALRRELADSAATAWLAGIALLAVDIVLPVPSSVVIGVLGVIYGTPIGGLVASLGLLANGLLGYWVCRAFGRALAIRMVGEKPLATGDRLFRRHGGWIVALSRLIPVGAEVVSMSAGLAAMPSGRFLAALACGSLPVGYAYAGIGDAGAENPLLVAVVCLAVSAVLWIAVAIVFRRHLQAEPTPSEGAHAKEPEGPQLRP